MKLFNTLMSKIFGHAEKPAPAPASTTTSAPPTPAAAPAGAQAPTPASGGAMPAAASAAPAQTVDVNAILNDMAEKNPEKLDWKKSIVDLMKLVGMDSSFGARKELAKELGYTGDSNDSAAMNIWLHKQVLRKLAENGGKVPQNLLD